MGLPAVRGDGSGAGGGVTQTGQQLADEQQITTPREWQPTGPVITGKTMLWIAACSLLGFAGVIVFIRAAFSIR